MDGSPLTPPLAADLQLTPEDRFAAWPEGAVTRRTGEEVGQDPILLHISDSTAADLGLSQDVLAAPWFTEAMAGHAPWGEQQNAATVYAGHQFGSFVPQLGDGRAVSIAQLRDGAGAPWEIQLKGAGRTPYSRFGDGRAVMRSSIREYLCSEHMAALGIPTTRALTLLATREGVLREEGPEPGAIVSRVAPSFIRFGHFEYFFHRGEKDKARQMADVVIDQFHPTPRDAEKHYEALFEDVVLKTADLMAHWEAVGFSHGVMNTDNMSILGLTIDYGPFGFLDTYDPGFICNHSDYTGRYAFDRQPDIGLWNLFALGTAFSDMIEVERLREILDGYAPRYRAQSRALLAAKLDLAPSDESEAMVVALLRLMKEARADYTATFRGLSAVATGGDIASWRAGFRDQVQAELEDWVAAYQNALPKDDATERAARMNRRNPKFILRNWVAETAIRALEDEGNIKELERVFRVVTAPFEEHTDDANLAAPPPENMCGLAVSCSS